MNIQPQNTIGVSRGYVADIETHVKALIDAYKRLGVAVQAYDDKLTVTCREEVRSIREHMEALRDEHIKSRDGIGAWPTQD